MPNQEVGSQEGLFCRHTNIQKKDIYNIVIELQKTNKKSMATGITQKSCTALFPLWSRPWHDMQAIAHARAVTRANQEKGGLGRR